MSLSILISLVVVSQVSSSALYPNLEEVIEEQIETIRIAGLSNEKTVAYIKDLKNQFNEDPELPIRLFGDENASVFVREMNRILSVLDPYSGQLDAFKNASVGKFGYELIVITYSLSVVRLIAPQIHGIVKTLKDLVPAESEGETPSLTEMRAVVANHEHHWRLLKFKMVVIDRRLIQDAGALHSACEAKKRSLLRLASTITTTTTTTTTTSTATLSSEVTSTTRDTSASKKRGKKRGGKRRKTGVKSRKPQPDIVESEDDESVGNSSDEYDLIDEKVSTSTTDAGIGSVLMDHNVDDAENWTLVNYGKKSTTTSTTAPTSKTTTTPTTAKTSTTRTTATTATTTTTRTTKTTITPTTTTTSSTTTTTTTPTTTSTTSTTSTTTTTSTTATTTTEAGSTAVEVGTSTEPVTESTSTTTSTTGPKLSRDAPPFQPQFLVRPAAEAIVIQMLHMSYGAAAALGDMARLCDGAIDTAPNGDFMNTAMPVCYNIHLIQGLVDTVRLGSHELVQMSYRLPSEPLVR
jgi:hypothetical protein